MAVQDEQMDTDVPVEEFKIVEAKMNEAKDHKRRVLIIIIMMCISLAIIGFMMGAIYMLVYTAYRKLGLFLMVIAFGIISFTPDFTKPLIDWLENNMFCYKEFHNEDSDFSDV